MTMKTIQNRPMNSIKNYHKYTTYKKYIETILNTTTTSSNQPMNHSYDDLFESIHGKHAKYLYYKLFFMPKSTCIFKNQITTCSKINEKYNVLLHNENKHTIPSISLYEKKMDNIFIYVSDNWNNKLTRNKTLNSMKIRDINVLYEKELRLSWDNSSTENTEIGKQTWGNGLFIGILHRK